MKRISCLIPVVLITLLPFMAFSQDDNYDAVYQQLTKEYTLNADGSMTYRYEKKLKLQSYRSFQNLYGETFVTYDPGHQSLNIREAYTIMADGKKVSSPKNAFNEVLPAFAANAPAYNRLREMVITHTGLERGAIENLDYEIRSEKGYYPFLMGNELLAESEPVKNLTVRIKIPASAGLNYRLLNSETTPAVTTENGFRVYTWKMTDVPAISAEESQKSGYELYPRLLFSTAKDRLSVYEWFTGQPAFRCESNEDMKQVVSTLQILNPEPMDLLLKLQDKVVNEVRLWPVPLKYTGFNLRPAVETYNSNGGTLGEKAILLTALLRDAGISAEPVIVVKKNYYDEKTGSLSDIEDILVKADLKETGAVYLSLYSLNSQNMKFLLPDKVLVDLNAGKKPVAMSTEEYAGKISCQAQLTFNDKKQLTGDISVTLRNGKDPWLNLLRDKNKAKGLISGGLSPSDLKEMKIFQPGQEESFFNYTVQKDNPFKKDTTYYFFTLPLLTNGMESWAPHQLAMERTVPFEVADPADEEYEFRFALPAGMKLFSPEKDLEISNKAGDFSFIISKEDNKIVVKKKIHFNKRRIPVEEYQDLKILIDRWNNDHTREIIFSD